MKYSMCIIGGILLLMLAACGPSPEQVATMTASAWTPTPPPTATPTPVPYGLSITVTGEGGAPVEGASVVFPESGNGEPVQTDAQGKFSWNNLQGDSASLTVSAQGYVTGQQSATLQRGPNEVTVALKRDPFGLLPSTACTAGEKLLYMEDFQSGKTNLQHYDAGPSPAQLGAAPDETGDTVLIHDFTNPKGDFSTYLSFNPDQSYVTLGDAVWRMRFINTKETNWALFWNSAGPNEYGGITTSGSGYGIHFNTARHITVMRNIWDASNQPVRNIGKTGFGDKVLIVSSGEWHYIEISTYQGHFQVWLDGKVAFDAQDDMPLPPGGFSIQGADSGVQYFDAISVCGLSAPFTSMSSPVPVASP